MMILKPEIEAEITMLPADSNPRRAPLRVDVTECYRCPMVLPSGNWDCRMVFPDANGRVDFGQKTRALIQFLSPKDVLLGLQPGDPFQLWEMGIIATGKVTKIIEAPTSASNATARMPRRG